MSNSDLVTYRAISPNQNNPRNHSIDTITIHCVVGQLSVESIGNIFKSKNAKASSNYGVGYDGRIGLYVDENARSWCSSSRENDNRAVTIEVACDKTEPYAVTPAAYNALIKLVADICKRNNIPQLKWRADKSLIGQVDKQNMTVHRWFANKSCPGTYLYNKHYEIADAVNNILNPQNNEQAKRTFYRVQVGAFKNKDNANKYCYELKDSGYTCFITQSDGWYRVQAGAFEVKANAEKLKKELESKGYQAIITTIVNP